MLRSLSAMFVVFGLLFAVPHLPAQAQSQRAYAPEDMRSLSRADQERVIRLEYSEQSNGRRIPDDQLRFYIDQINRSNWSFSRIRQESRLRWAEMAAGIRAWVRDNRAACCAKARTTATASAAPISAATRC